MQTRRLSLAAALLLAVLPWGCSGLFSDAEDKDPGKLIIHFSNPRYGQTKAGGEIPDSSAFLLTVLDSKGRSVYEGTFGNSPEELEVPPGKYSVSARSGSFSRPKFDSPQYGDDQVVEVPSGGVTRVTLKCTQVNSGIRLRIAPGFLTAYPQGVFFVQNEDGSLQYNYRETRVAYFNPGDVDVVLDDGTEEGREVLFTRRLEPREILSVAVSVAEAQGRGASRFDIVIDTTREWVNEAYVIGGGGSGSSGVNDGSDPEDAYDVAQAADNLGEKGVWVYGYIVGCFASASSRLTTDEPFPKNTHIAIASRPSVSDKSVCVAVELKSGSEARKQLNLVDNPELVGRKVFIKGDIPETMYFGTTGLKNVSDFELR